VNRAEGTRQKGSVTSEEGVPERECKDSLKGDTKEGGATVY